MEIRCDFISSQEFNVAEKLIYLILNSNIDGDTCNMTIKEIAGCANTSSKTVSRTLVSLAEKGLIRVIYLKPLDIKTILVNKKMQSKGVGNKVCKWCGCKTFILHEHHFPTRREDGGKAVVDICPNCHQEYHFLESNIKIVDKNYINIKTKYKKELNTGKEIHAAMLQSNSIP